MIPVGTRVKVIASTNMLVGKEGVVAKAGRHQFDDEVTVDLDFNAAGGIYYFKPSQLKILSSPEAERHPNSARFHEILSELAELHDKKQRDYGRGDDPFANVRASSEWGVSAWVGAMVRATDKIRRLQSLIQNGKLENESAEDSLRDLAVYSVIALVLFEQEVKEAK